MKESLLFPSLPLPNVHCHTIIRDAEEQQIVCSLNWRGGGGGDGGA